MQNLPDPRLAPGRSSRPRPHLPRRVMAHVLSMPTIKLGDPVAVFVLVEPGDAAGDAFPLREPAGG